ncbi:DUF2442 domain-containing protein [uncultured Selenomonas sp.]|uniref:DUF2442 domain-containing protein n=1 Tax=uncultured Selenomonas sp. TaxID=159275 RepID=UPI0025CFC507|nr:DUF2442 domain-containing protein [uncultured Selenomonas sp.]
MYIRDGIAYASEPYEDLTITDFRIIDSLYMVVTFSTGEERIFDVAGLLRYPAFAPLSDRSVFDTARLEHGFLTWQNGAIDIAPEAVYKESYPYNTHAANRLPSRNALPPLAYSSP